ncbi:major facilitator superfamily domain-containing protein [Phyllosticta citrichinensis]
MARAFQEIGAAFTIPAAQAQLAIQFADPARKAKALGIWGASGSLGFIIGLILGGVLTDLLGWRWIFWVSLILSAFVIPAAYFILPRPSPERAANPRPNDRGEESGARRSSKSLFQSVKYRLVRFDALGIALGVPGILLLTCVLSSANSVGWNAVQITTANFIATLLLVLAPQAVLAPYLFRSLSFYLTLILVVNTFAARQALNECSLSAIIIARRFDFFRHPLCPIYMSVLFIPLGVSALNFNMLAGGLVPVLGARIMFILGCSFAIPGVLLFSFVDAGTSSYWHFKFPGMVLYITANFVVVSSASRSDQGAAAGVFNVALQVGGSVVGLAVLTAVAQGVEKRSPTASTWNLDLTLDTHFESYCPVFAVGVRLSPRCIIALPGLGGHAFWSFKARKQEFMWLRDGLRKSVPSARVLVYGYDSRLQKSNFFQSLQDLSWSFAHALLSQIKASVKESGSVRPVVLVSQSLGGLVIKEFNNLTQCLAWKTTDSYKAL